MRILYVALLFATCTGCPRQPAASPLATTPELPQPIITGLPVSFPLKQRSTVEVPGTDGELSLSIDDITHGQVMVTLVRKKEANLLGPISLKTGESTAFRFGASDYTLKLTGLNNQLIGDDEATFSISDATSHTTTEEQKIQHLISAVESLNGAVFIRNGSEHTPHEAAEHMRRKLSASSEGIHTAEDFIQQIATGSSISGEEYQIRFADGRTVPAHEYLREELLRMSDPPTNTEPSGQP